MMMINMHDVINAIEDLYYASQRLDEAYKAIEGNAEVSKQVNEDLKEALDDVRKALKALGIGK